MKFLNRTRCFAFTLMCLFSSCTPTTHKGFVKRADAVYAAMIRILEDVEHPSDFYLLQALRPLYIEIAEIASLAEKQQDKNPNLFNEEILEAPHQEALKVHLSRIYKIEGGRDAIESVARDGLIALQKALAHPKKSHH